MATIEVRNSAHYRESHRTLTSITTVTSYCPSVLILTAGEHLHINKGRLHAFRKMSSEQLPPDDCHHELRAYHLNLHPIIRDVCISITFDW
jgi:hypothetical protein